MAIPPYESAELMLDVDGYRPMKKNEWIGPAVFAFVLTALCVWYWRGVYHRYWLLTDGVQTTARVINDDGRKVIYYTYTVNGTNFAGDGPRDRSNPQYKDVVAGESTSVWYSVSRPWISTSRRDDDIFSGKEFITLVMLLDVVCIGVAIQPLYKTVVRKLSPPR